MSEFVAIDVETANPDMSSICQVGIAVYHDWNQIADWKSLVNPEDYFDGFNISIHGIDEDSVRDAPTMPEVAAEIRSFIHGKISVCHTPFDRVAIGQAFEKHRLQPLECFWLDSAKVARRTWEEFALRGYGLKNLCQFLGYEYVAHDALEDARAAAVVLQAAVRKSGIGIEDWLDRSGWPIAAARTGIEQTVERAGDPAGPLFGEVIVFTGELSISRMAAADFAAKLGCEVDSRVTKRTTILLVGDQDVRRLAGHVKSSKHRRAEELRALGQDIRTLRQSDFLQLAQAHSDDLIAPRWAAP